MAHRLAPLAIAVSLALAGFVLMSPGALGQEGMYPMAPPPPNYYVGPGSPYGTVAAMYPCPRPTPPLVGWTYITYGPLAPHEFLYTHENHYQQRHCDGSVTWTKVCYGHTWGGCPSVMRQVPVLCMPPAQPNCVGN